MFENIPDWISFTVICSVALTALVIWVGLYRASKLSGSHQTISFALVSMFLVVWLGLAFGLGLNGFFRPSPAGRIPGIAYTLLPLVIGYALVSTSSSLRKTIGAITPHWMIGVQVYRILGILFLVLFAQGRLPGVFALPAGIGDMLIGITAPLVAYFYFVKHPWARGLALFWNIVGIADLTLAVLLGVLTSPGPLQLLSLNAPNELVTTFPIVLIPAFVVPLSILLHLFSLRALTNTNSVN